MEDYSVRTLELVDVHVVLYDFGIISERFIPLLHFVLLINLTGDL